MIRYLRSFIFIQTVVFIAALPVLVWWGLPVSLMTWVGNLIFSPILTIFLMVSTLLFFAELFSIPNGYLVNVLEAITHLWDYMLSFGSKHWFICFKKPDLLTSFFFFIVYGILFAPLFFRIRRRVHVWLTCGAILFFSIWLYATGYFISPTHALQYLPGCNQKLALIASVSESVSVIDYGFFNRKQSPEKFVAYELKPYLIQTYGSMKLGSIVLHRPKARSLTAAHELCQTFDVKRLQVAYFDKPLSKYGWKCFFDLKRCAQEHGICWERMRTEQNFKKQ